MRWLTAPISWAFAVISFIRWKLYRWRIFLHSKSAPAPVISVGNIALGGTGKTPCVIWLARELKSRGFDPIILTRGYKRSVKDRLFILGDIPEARLAGDEPAVMSAHLLDIPIVVHRDRISSAKEIGGGKKRIFILDDGFQHLKLRREADIVLLPAKDPFSGGHFFPFGNLRDGKWRIDEADILIFIGEGDEIPFELNHLKNKIFRASKIPTAMFTLDNVKIPWKAIEGEKVIAFSAIGAPESFVATLKKLGAEVVAQKNFRDHHQFKIADIHAIESLAEAHRADILITTEKDAVRLAGIKPRLTTYFVSIEFKPEKPEMLMNALLKAISREA